MKNVCRFNLVSGAVLEVEAGKVQSITGDYMSGVRVNVGGYFYTVAHNLEEAQAIWDAAKPKVKTVAPEKRQSLLDAANAIGSAIDLVDSKEGCGFWLSVEKRLAELGKGGPL